jgi:hypothetical protein
MVRSAAYYVHSRAGKYDGIVTLLCGMARRDDDDDDDDDTEEIK